MKKGEEFLAYTSAKNSFYRINSYVYDFINNININEDEAKNHANAEEIEQLRAKGLISTERDDNHVVDKIRMHYMMRAFSKDHLSLTIAPTLSCNLKCPYCFEKNKCTAIMTEETCDKLLGFIAEHKLAKSMNIAWYGGEPLIGAKAIRYILRKIDTIENIKLAGHSMITNGTLLKGENLELFRQMPLDSIQITIDGNKQTHDKETYKNGQHRNIRRDNGQPYGLCRNVS